MILLLYIPYYLGIEWVRDWTSLIHGIIGFVLLAVFVWHYLGRNSAKSNRRNKSTES
jgi:hypothetical protein